ncbi:MAG: hypothetical protein LEGION0398_MBIBDBAK_01050 [Legionellaceae bacterium]
MLSPKKIPFLPQAMSIEAGDLHIWQFNTQLQSNLLMDLSRYLSEEENQRSQFIKIQKKRQQFIITRGKLRHILSLYLKLSPSQVKFAIGKHGKPYLINKNTLLEFNLSHSNNHLLIAITNNIPVGIDIQYMDTSKNIVKIAKRLFSIEEYEQVISIKNEEQKHVFYELWTQKEAIVKMLGKGVFHQISYINSNKYPYFKQLNPLLNYLGAVSTAKEIKSIHYYFVD